MQVQNLVSPQLSGFRSLYTKLLREFPNVMSTSSLSSAASDFSSVSATKMCYEQVMPVLEVEMRVHTCESKTSL